MKFWQDSTLFFRRVSLKRAVYPATVAVLITACLFTGVFAISKDALALSKDASSAAAEEHSERGDAPVRWLPDLKVLVNAPATTINLGETVRQLCAEGRLGAPETASLDDVELAIVEGQSDYADLSIDGSNLTVAWKPDAVGSSTIVVEASKKDDPDEHVYISFKAESWKIDYLTILLVVVGGGGLFLLGMRRMSEGLQAISGKKLQRMINLFTDHRVYALGVGAFVTTLVQSSTATSVMTLGFVNTGLMTLKQAIGVLMGANIGTTTTGWLFTLNIGQFGLPTLGVASVFYLFSKNERVKNVSIFLIGLGMIFFGLETLKAGLSPLSDAPEFTAFMNAFRADSILGACMCVFVGCVATALTHSSAAILAITITLASLGSIDINSSAAIVLGSNIGTSLTPLIVAVGAPCTTRRAAYFHFIFNTIGVIWVMAIFFPVFMPTINALGSAFHLQTPGKIALTHTLFNVANTLVFLPLVGPIARELEKRVVDKKKVKKTAAFPTTNLSFSLLSVPTSAIAQLDQVVQQTFDDCIELTAGFKRVFDDSFQNSEDVESLFQFEEKLDHVQDETILFISRLLSKPLPSDDLAHAQRQTRFVQELEKVSDYLVSILKSFLKIKDANLISPDILNEIFNENVKNTGDTLIWLKDALQENSDDVLNEMHRRRSLYVANAKDERDQYVKLMSSEGFDPIVIIAIDAQLTFWRRVYEHLVNIAEATTDGASKDEKKKNL